MSVTQKEEHVLIREAAERFLKNEYACEQLYAIKETKKSYSSDIWQKVVGLGWTGVIVPEEYEGWGREDSFQTLLVLLEEMGRHLFVGPYFSTMLFGALGISRYGTDEQKRDFLPKIAAGERKVTFAPQELPGAGDPDQIVTRATATAGGYELQGIKVLVDSATASNFCIVPCRTVEGSSGWDGITLFLVDLSSPGVAVMEIPTLGLEKECEVRFDRVKVRDTDVLGGLHGGGPAVEELLSFAAVARCSEMLGALDAALKMTVQYSLERVQYGKAIGSNQVIQHYLANVWMDLVSSRQIVKKAASLIDVGEPGRLFASIAKAWMGKALIRSTERCIQIHGAIGTTEEHNISYYYKQAKAWDLSLGSSDWHLKRVAQSLTEGNLAGLTV